MLSIRLQRTGRKSLAMYRVVVQDSRRTPTSGDIVTQLGTYNPHTKQLNLDEPTTLKFLKNGAQPTDRVVLLLNSKKIKLPSWVKQPKSVEKKTKNPEKLRKNAPVIAKDEAISEAEEQPVEIKSDEVIDTVEKPTENVSEEKVSETSTETETKEAE